MIFYTNYKRYKKAKHFILLACFVFLVFSGLSQTGVINNGAKMIVNSGAILKISGSGADYTNYTSGGYDGSIDLDGKIVLAGDWTNNATAGNVLINTADGDGYIVFNGSSLQTIGGTGSSLFENFTLNNSAGLRLSSDILVKRVLSLSNGLLILNSSDLTIGLSGSITGTFGSTNMIVTNGTGFLRKVFDSNGSFEFPIGEITGTNEYSPVDFTLTGNSGFSSAWVGARVVDALYPENTSTSDYLTRYWRLSSSGINSPKYDADFYYKDADIQPTEASIFATEYDNGLTRSVYSTVTAATNKLSVTGLTSIENTYADYTGEDGTAPTTTISTTESDPTNSSPTIPFTVTFSEAVSGFAYTDINIDNGSTSAVTTSDNTIFNFDVTPVKDSTITIDIASGVAQDIADNDNTAATTYRIDYDSTNPTVGISSTESDPTNSSFTVSIYFDEVVTGFTIDDITVGNATKGTFIPGGDNQNWTLQVNPTSDGTVTVDIAGAAANDAAGNGNDAATQYSIDYDASAPTVIISSGESDPTSSDPIPITITFNEEVIGFALTDIAVGNGSATNLVNTTPNRIWTADVSPISDGTVTVDIAAAVANDAAGNENTEAAQFTIDYDGTAPTVAITSGESDPTNTTPIQVTIAFSEVVNNFIIGDITVGNGSAGNLQVVTTDQEWTADITPTGSGEVTVDVAADVATDDASNGNIAADQFSITYDSDAPTATYTPADNATGVSLNANLSINFNENIVKGTGNIVIMNASGPSTHETIDVTSGQVVIVDNVATINPSNDFLSTNDYYVQIDASAFDDNAGNSFAGISSNTTWNFTAVDANSPYITLTNPLDNAIDVSLTSNLVITFSEAVLKGSGNITIMNATDALTHETIAVSSGAVSVATNVVTINPSIDFEGEKDYYVLIASGAFNDGTLDFTGISDQTEWNFTTEDVTAPTISSLNPTDDDSDVSISSDLQITFDEDVAKGTGNIIITNASGPTTHETIDVTSGQVTIVDNVATINPSIDFDGETTYYVEMASGVFTDASSNANAFAGISGSTSWNFETEDVAAPTVVVSTGESSPTNSSSFSVTLTFNEAVYSLSAGNISVTNGSPSNLNTSDNITYTVDIATSIEDTIKISVPAGAAQDAAGNDNQASNEIKLYYDITSPTVTITGPTGPVASAFVDTITFNEGIVDLTIGDITLGGTGTASVTNLSNIKPDTTWVATVTPTADGTITVDVAVTEVTDYAGNGNEASNTFSIEYDGSGPEIIGLVPVNTASDISIDSDLKITFDENVYLNSGYEIHIYESGVGEIQTIDVGTLSGNGTNTITINPSDFNGETDYYVLIDAEAFMDVLGNGFAGISSTTDWAFTTTDVDPPTVSTLSPVDGAIDVLVGSDLQITFNENVNKNIGSITIMNDDTDQEFEVIDVTTGQVTVSSNVATIDPSDDFDGEVNYYVLVGKSTFQDGKGNNFDGITATTDWNFYTEDINPPVVSLLSPANGAENVALTEDLVITFDEEVIKGTGNITIMDASGTHETIDVNSTQVTVATNIVTINPSVDFDENTYYYVLIDAGAITDDDGNVYGGMSAETTWNFTSGDLTNPTVSIYTPEQDATDVSVSSNLVLEFDENVVKGSGNITIYNQTSALTHETINVNSTQVTVATNIVTINPSVDFDGESVYYILIDNGAIQDEAGNDYSGISLTTEWNFTTEDIVGPTITGLSPSDGETGVSVVSNLELTFNENVAKGLGTITITDETASATHESFNISDSRVTVSLNTVIIDPVTNFLGTNDYSVQIPSTAITDISGNEFNGISGSTDWNFTTGSSSAPYVDTYSPADNSVDVSISTDLVLTFNETVVAGTGNITIRNALTSATVETIDITSGQVSISSNVVTINPATDLTGETNYYILIDNGAFEDTEGNAYGGISSETTWNFTTEDILAPTVTAFIPADDAENINLAAVLEIQFSEEIFKGSTGNITIMNADADSIYETIEVTSPSVIVTTNVVDIDPVIDFLDGTNYYILIDNTVFVDGSGNAYDGITDETIWNFSTVDAAGPTILTLYPENNAVNVALDTNLQIIFNEPVIANEGLINIMTSAGIFESIDVLSNTITIKSDTVIIDPIFTFSSDTDYYVLIDNNTFHDYSGNSFTGISDNSTWSFSTGEFVNPSILSVSPEDNATGVDVNTNLKIIFSEPVTVNSGSVNIMTSTGIYESIDVTTNKVSVNSDTVNIDPGNTMDGETDYYILIESGAFNDLSGNAFPGITDETTWNFTTQDITPPTVSITSSANATVTDDFMITITFSEEVTGFESADIDVTNATLSDFTNVINGMEWTVMVAPTDDGEVTVDIAADVAQDAAGNPNTAASQFSIIYDSGVGIEQIKALEISAYSSGHKVIVEFKNADDYQFEEGKIEIYNVLGQKIVEKDIFELQRFETEVDYVSHMYIIKVILDESDYVKQLYIE